MKKNKEQIKNRIKQLMKVDELRSWEDVDEDWKELVELSKKLQE